MATKRKTKRKAAGAKRRPPARRKKTIAQRAKKHGVSEAVYKTYLSERTKLAKQYLGRKLRGKQLTLWK